MRAVFDSFLVNVCGGVSTSSWVMYCLGWGGGGFVASLPDVVQEVPGLAGREIFGYEELGPDPLEVPECPGGVRGQRRLCLSGVDREEMRNRSASNVPVEHRGQEGPFGSQHRRYRVPRREVVSPDSGTCFREIC